MAREPVLAPAPAAVPAPAPASAVCACGTRSPIPANSRTRRRYLEIDRGRPTARMTGEASEDLPGCSLVRGGGSGGWQVGAISRIPGLIERRMDL